MDCSVAQLNGDITSCGVDIEFWLMSWKILMSLEPRASSDLASLPRASESDHEFKPVNA